MRTPPRGLTPSCPSLLLAGVVLVGCGGSSSETPPPLEPLPVNLHYDRASTALSGEVPVVADAGVVKRTEEAPPESGDGPPARATWGVEHGEKPAQLK